MASPQKENGFTPIANELLEALCRTHISGDARRLLDVIIRMVYGYKDRKNSEISTQYIITKTGLSRMAIYRARKLLKEMNIIGIYKNVDSLCLTYSIQKDYTKWKVSTKKKTVYKNVDRVSTKLSTKCLQNGHKQYSKEIKITNKDNSLKKEHFLSLWERYPRKQGVEKASEYYNKQIKTDKDKEDIENALTNYLNSKEFHNTDPKYRPHGKTWFNKGWVDFINLPKEEIYTKEDEEMDELRRKGFIK